MDLSYIYQEGFVFILTFKKWGFPALTLTLDTETYIYQRVLSYLSCTSRKTEQKHVFLNIAMVALHHSDSDISTHCTDNTEKHFPQTLYILMSCLNMITRKCGIVKMSASIPPTRHSVCQWLSAAWNNLVTVGPSANSENRAP
jgi:hypothetical protein